MLANAELTANRLRWEYEIEGVEGWSPFSLLTSHQIEEASTRGQTRVSVSDEAGPERIVDTGRMVHYLPDSPESVHRVRRVDLEKSLARIQLPVNWTEGLHCGMVNLAADTNEYREVVAGLAGSGLVFARVVALQRVQNRRLLVQYENYKELFRERYGEGINEHRLYHGTSAECVEKIWSQGFNR